MQMNRSVVFFFFATFLQAMPSWGYESSVIVDGKEWLQPKDFINYSYDQVEAVCPPPSWKCLGSLPGSAFDLTGYTWASISEAGTLFNTYGVEPPFTEPFQRRTFQEASIAALLEDFEPIGELAGAPALFGKVRPYDGSTYSAGFFGAEIYNAFDVFVNPSTQGVWLWRPVTTDFKVHLEEPIDSATHSGIGNLRGWAIADDGIDRVEIYIDGKYKYDAPYGGSRADVGEKYPDVPDSDDSGFSLAFGYSNLGVGEHTAIARAFNTLGEYTESKATFNVLEFDKKFIPKTDIVDTAHAEVTLGGDEILLDNVLIGERRYELRLRWRTQEQGFEIIEIR